MVREIEVNYDDKDNKLNYHWHTLPCLHDDDFCKPTTSTHSPLFDLLKKYGYSFQFTPLLDVCLNLITVIGLKPNTFLIARIMKLPLLKLLSMTPNLKSDPLVLKWFATNPHLYIPLHTLTLHYKKEGFNMHTGNCNSLQLPED